MKITIITNYWKESNGGGVKTYVTNLVEELEKINNLKVDVLFREGFDDKNHHIPGNKLIFSLKSFLNLLKSKPDAVYTQGTWYCLLGGALYKLLNHDMKLIHTFHTEPSAKLSFFGKKFFQCLLNRCDYVTFVSNHLRDVNIKLTGLKFKNTAITYAGITSPKKISSDEIIAFYNLFGIKKDSIILLAHGLTSTKGKSEGAKILIKSIKILKKKYPNIVLILTKEGQYSDELKKLSKIELLEDSIIFTGNLENPNIPLTICSIYTHITLIEGGVSLAILEAMITGKPIITTGVGGIGEAVENNVNGLIAEPNPEDIAKKIEYLLENEELALQLVNNAKSTVKEKFTWKNTAKTYLELSKR